MKSSVSDRFAWIAALAVIAVLAPIPSALGQEAAPADTGLVAAVPGVGVGSPGLSPGPGRVSGIVGTPLLLYGSETGGGLGARVLAYLGSEGARASSLTGSFIYTQENQIRGLEVDVHAVRENIQLKSEYTYWNTPLKFYGLGPNSKVENAEVYTPVQSRFYVALFKFVTPRLKLGLRYEYENVIIENIEEGGRLDRGLIRGSRQMDVSGLGILAAWDTRDRGFSTRGAYHQFYLLFFADEFGGEDDFRNLIIDLRWYREVVPGHVLAFQAFTYGVTRYAPFQRYAALGGRHHSRGYRRARYVDRVMFAGQVEYRTPMWWRLGAVGFVGVAEVGRGFDRFTVGYLKPTVGAGLRFAAKYGSIRVRFDVALGLEEPRLYLSLREAF